MEMLTSPAPTLRRWIQQSAFPLWAGIGFDMATGTVWEELDATGLPLADLTKRLRVQARQVYCFALSGQVDHLQKAVILWRFIMDRGFEKSSGNLAGKLLPQGEILTAPHDLYDLAFVMLAASALIGAGVPIGADLTRLEISLARLKADVGWHQNAAQNTPRSQNPHMHLFEAATALFAVTADQRFLRVAEECLDLFQGVFLQADGRVFEYFDAQMRPLMGAAQAVEPGHMAEWVFLLDRFEAATGGVSGVDVSALFGAAWALRDGAGLLPDIAFPTCETRRLWPQTELLKAAVVLQRRGFPLPAEARPKAILGRFWAQYVQTATPGGWQDRRNATGVLISETMPASSLYHVLTALRFYQSGGRHLQDDPRDVAALMGEIDA